MHKKKVSINGPMKLLMRYEYSRFMFITDERYKAKNSQRLYCRLIKRETEKNEQKYVE
jgi:hypothetical protein